MNLQDFLGAKELLWYAAIEARNKVVALVVGAYSSRCSNELCLSYDTVPRRETTHVPRVRLLWWFPVWYALRLRSSV